MRAAQDHAEDRRISRGVDVPKSRAMKIREGESLANWARVVWIANGRRHTPDYWRAKALEELTR